MHKTVDELIGGELVPIDENILPVVRWLNSFPSVATRSSCEGLEVCEMRWCGAYVGFRCSDLDELRQIVQVFHNPRSGYIEIINVDNGFEYVMRFYSIWDRERFVQRLEILSDEVIIGIDAVWEYDEKRCEAKAVKNGGYVLTRSRLTTDWTKAKRFLNEDIAEEFLCGSRFEDRDGCYIPV